MNIDKQESISALMDDEYSSDDVALLNNDESKQTWQRYHLIRDSLQGNLPGTVDLDLHQRIHDAIAQESIMMKPTVLAPKARSSMPYLKPVAGFAIAASVTAAVLLGVQSFQGNDTQNAVVPVVAEQVISNELIRPVTLTSSQLPQVINTPESLSAKARMNRYMMNYNELRANSAVQGMAPYVRMIGYESE